MNRSYSLGIAIVTGTILASVAICLATVGDRPASSAVGPAGERLQAHPVPIGDFTLVERSGRPFGGRDLDGDVWIAAFIFTRCPTSCPRISAQMKALQSKLADTGVRLVSISVDPEHDTPEVLSNYADSFGADPIRWSFLTGPLDDVEDLIARFQLAARRTTAAEQDRGAESIAHSQKLALVERGNRLVGYFDANDPDAIARLQVQARKLDDRLGHLLPTVNAALNGSCAVLLLLGLTMIRSGRVRLHVACMVSALIVSALFLASYLGYHFLVVDGVSVPFQGVGRLARRAYFSILLSHTVLAVVDLPLIVTTVVLALRRRWHAHARIARITFPIWLYVSITGVVVYWMLYRMDFSGVTMTILPT